jgi:signal transduction histidine kinase/DNA-binding response OmpR family regulator
LKTTSLIFFFLVLLYQFATAQKTNSFSQTDSPLITNYLPKNYSANVQNWAVIQDHRGVLYFGNGEGILEYDGVSWRIISIPNDVARCFAIDEDGTIYVGGINEFGYLTPDSTGELKYISLNKFISKQKLNIGDLFRIIINRDGLYIQTFSTLMLLEEDKSSKSSYLDRIIKKPSIKIWNTKTRINPILSIDNRLFVHERNVGLQEMINGKLVMLPGGEQFAQDLICILLPYPSPFSTDQTRDKKILVGSLRYGMYLFDGNKFEKFANEADKYLIENRLYYRGALLGDGTYALGTQLGGIVVIDQNGKLKKIIDKKSGLNDNTVWDLFNDNEGNLWAALDNGISKILYPTSVNFVSEKSGFEGSIHSINKIDNELILATNSGLYSLEENNSDTQRFQKVEGISVQSWGILPLKNSYLAITNDGLIEVQSKNIHVVDNLLRYSYCAIQSSIHSNIIFAGLHNGLAVFENTELGVKSIGKVSGIENGIENILEDSKANLWLNDISGSVFIVQPPGEVTNLNGYKEISNLSESMPGKRLKMFKYLGEVYFYSERNIFQLNEKTRKVIPAELFSKIFSDSNHSIIHIYADRNEVLWCAAKIEGKIVLIEISFVNGKQKISVHKFLELFEDDIPSGFVSLALYVENNFPKTLWIGGGNILLKNNFEKKLLYSKSTSFKSLIRKISVTGNKPMFSGYKPATDIENEIPFSNNSLIFEFAAASFVNEQGNDFQYLLEGFDQNWSEWSGDSKKEYTNLSAGEYNFKVRSRNAIGVIGDEATFQFVVLPPWYRSWWANILGIILLLVLINYIIRYRVKYLNNKNIALEKMIAERTAEINEQKLILQKQANQLLELDQIKSNFFANISHEFRTPLTLIKGQLENVLGLINDEAVKKKLNVAFSNSNRLNRLINQVLDLSKLESGKMKLEFELTDIVSLLKNRVASFDSLAEQNKIFLEFYSKIENLYLNIDKEKIEEVVDNLISNAFKFTPPNGKIILTIDKEKIEFSDNAIVTIKDTGIGIPDDKLPHIFDRFFQADSSSTKQFEGSGLGLAIVKELVEMHGGSISVKSELNLGTTFSIRLPIEETELIISETDEIRTSENIQLDEEKSVILIVEDNFDVRNYIKENLELHYKIEEAVNGEDGIKKAIETIPDLIITDVMMPKVDGFELCTKLKNDQRTSHIPIIILTAKADEQNKLDGLQIGADEFLAKPFSPRELEIRVGNLIHIRQLLREKYKEISVIRSEDVKANPIDKEFLDKAFQLIKDHLEDQQFSVQKLADEMAISVSQLNRKLNALINQSAGKLIRSTKLDYAAKLLEKNAGNITEIAYRIGFADVSSFTNSFKEKFGISPSEYLKNLK